MVMCAYRKAMGVPLFPLDVYASKIMVYRILKMLALILCRLTLYSLNFGQILP